jgi:hypothetical protein
MGRIVGQRTGTASAVRALARGKGGALMAFDIVILQPLVALIAGILILTIPRLLNYIVAITLILFGLFGLWPRFMR